ncbi:MAG: ABC transporter permease [Trueperaceae bacterium]
MNPALQGPKPSSVARAGRRALSRLWRAMYRNPLIVACVLVLAAIMLAAVFAPLLTEYEPNEINVRDAYAVPGGEHLLGTDDLGRDLYSRILYGGRVSLMIAFGSALGAGIMGMIVGLLAGYFRRLDSPLMLLMDGMMAFPSLVLALVVVALLGPNQFNILLALILVFGPPIARVVRSSVLVLRELAFIEAAHATAIPARRIIIRHLMPNAIAPWLVQVTLILAYALLTEAGLSFLGVGGSTSNPSWGGIISEGRLVLSRAPWLTLYPGLTIAITVLAVNLVADALRDRLDPRLRGS